MTRLPERWFFACVKRAWLAMVIVAAAPSVCSAQAASASTLKAAFTLNFLKFTEWPDLKPGQPILVCVSGEEQIASAIVQATSGRPVDDHAIRVLRIAPGGAVRDCNLLFVTDREPQGLATILEEARPFPMLTVSDAHESAEHGAIIELFVESGRLRFAINVDALARSRIKLSSRLVSLAKIVRDTEGR